MVNMKLAVCEKRRLLECMAEELERNLPCGLLDGKVHALVEELRRVLGMQGDMHAGSDRDLPTPLPPSSPTSYRRRTLWPISLLGHYLVLMRWGNRMASLEYGSAGFNCRLCSFVSLFGFPVRCSCMHGPRSSVAHSSVLTPRFSFSRYPAFHDWEMGIFWYSLLVLARLITCYGRAEWQNESILGSL